MIKTALLDLVSMKNVAVQWRTGHLPSFFVPTPGNLTAQESHPREFAIKGKKNANAQGSAREPY